MSINVLAATSVLVFYMITWNNMKNQISAARKEFYEGNMTRLKIQLQNYDSTMAKTIGAILICCCVTYPPYVIVWLLRSVKYGKMYKFDSSAQVFSISDVTFILSNVYKLIG